MFLKLSVPLNHELCYSLRTRQHIRQILSRKVKILLHTPSISLWLDYSCNEKQIKSCSFEKKPKISQNVTIYSPFEKKPQKFPKLSQYIFYIYALESPSLEIFKWCLDVVLGNFSGWSCLSRKVGSDSVQRSLPTILSFCEAQFNAHQNQVLHY